MCYRCKVCNDLVPRGPMKTWTVYKNWIDDHGRRRKDISKQLRICGECEDDLLSGVDLRIMLEEYKEEVLRLPPPASPPPAVKVLKYDNGRGVVSIPLSQRR